MIPIGTKIMRGITVLEKRPHGWVDAGGNVVEVDEDNINPVVITEGWLLKHLVEAIKNNDQQKITRFVSLAEKYL